MVPVVRFLDYSHDEDGPWCGENDKGLVFTKWWFGTDGTYFGLFLGIIQILRNQEGWVGWVGQMTML